MNLLISVTHLHRLRNDENTHVGRSMESTIHITDAKLVVFYKSMHALANHAKSLLQCLFEGATYSHHLTDAFHG